MKRIIHLTALLWASLAFSQSTDTIISGHISEINNLFANKKNYTFGGFAQIDYSQNLSRHSHQTGSFHLKRIGLHFGYRLNKKVLFVTEIEYMDLQNLQINQAYLDIKVNRKLYLRGGLLLIPMGIVNERRNPPSLNGVERTYNDHFIIPTTWREFGVGIAGNFPDLKMNYQLYIVNGILSYADEKFYLSGEKGIRGGRQSGAQTIFSSPNVSSKINLLPFNNFNFGISAYWGKSQSNAYNNIDRNDDEAIAFADSTIVGISMFGADLQYLIKGLHLKAQLNYIALSNTEKYNTFISDPVGSALFGYYVEAGYDILRPFSRSKSQLIIYSRFEHYNTHHKVSGGIQPNGDYENDILTGGLNLKFTPQVAIKSDLQIYKDKSTGVFETRIYGGLAVSF